MHIFEDGFEEDKWLSDQIMQISNEASRVEARELAKQVLMPMYQEMKKAYGNIERQLLQQSEQEKDYRIATGITECSMVDGSHSFLQPMRMEDLEEQVISWEEIANAIKTNTPVRLYKVYFDGNYQELQQLLERKETFPISIKTEYGEYQGKAKVQQTQDYQVILNELYEEFVRNEIEWQPVNAPYLMRMLDVMLVMADLPRQGEVIEKITVDFRNYAPQIRYQMVPLWNVRRIQVNTSAYPRLTPAGIHYEHMVSGDKLRKQCQYLVTNNVKIWDMFRGSENEAVMTLTGKKQADDLIIWCDQRRPVVWKLLEIAQVDNSNYGGDSEIYLNCKQGIPKNIHTQSQAIYFAGQYDTKELQLIAVSMQKPVGFQKVETYDMDAFTEDTIYAKDAELYFTWRMKASGEAPNLDLLSFQMTRLQRIYPEYRCVCRVI